MAYTLAYLTSPVPGIPDRDASGSSNSVASSHRSRPPDRREHFGTEQSALRRARELFPASEWLDLRLYGPDGRLLADQSTIAAKLGIDNSADLGTLKHGQTEEPIP